MIAIIDISLRSIQIMLHNPDVMQQRFQRDIMPAIDFLDSFCNSNMYKNMWAYRDSLDIGVRIAFGGELFKKPTVINAKNMKKLECLIDYSPAYSLFMIRIIKFLKKIFSENRIIAFFETSFFLQLPSEGQLYAIPQEFLQSYQIKRTGFNGIFHEYSAKSYNNEKCISIVLDRHTTVCALESGKPMSISLGMTPLEGIMGRTTSGDVDPGIILQYMQDTHSSVFVIDDLLKNKSGFLGITGYDLTMKEYVSLWGKDEKVNLAFNVYQNHMLKYIGEAITVLMDVESIVFTGCYVQTLWPVIVSLLKKLSFLGVSLKEMPINLDSHFQAVTRHDSRIHVYINDIVVPMIMCDSIKETF